MINQANYILPPKRFQDPSKTCFDPLRPKKWFHLLLRRKSDLWRLREAFSAMKSGDMTQVEAARGFRVNERELRDYAKMAEGKECHVPLPFQVCIDSAYRAYQAANAENDFRFYLILSANHMGLNPRHVTELWDVWGNYLPSGYQP